MRRRSKPMASPDPPSDPPNPTATAGAAAPAAPAEPPAAEPVGAFLHNLLTQPVVQEFLAGARYRVHFAQPIETLDKNVSPAPASRWSAQIYDYTNNRSLEAAADFPEAANASVTPSAAQPLPSAEEWEEAVEIVRRDEQ